MAAKTVKNTPKSAPETAQESTHESTPESTPETVSENAPCEKKSPVKIRVLTMIRSAIGAFDRGGTYEVSGELAETLIKTGRAEKCS